MKRDHQAHPDLQTRLAPINAIEPKTRTMTIVWTTGSRVRRRQWLDWDTSEEFMEELSLDPAHVRMARLLAGAPLLNNHNRYDLSDVVGVVENAALERAQGVATVRFSDREEVAPIFRDVQNKIIRNVSVGYITHKVEVLPPDDRSEGLPIHRVVDWEPVELSLVPIGADAGAGFRNHGAIENQGARMQNTNDGAIEEATAQTVNQVLEDLGPRARKYYNDLIAKNSLPQEQLNDIFVRGDSLKEIYGLVLKELAKKTDATPVRGGFDHYSQGGLDGEQVLAMSEALHARYGGPAPSERARDYVGLRVPDMARMALERRGISARGLSANQIVERALHSTTDFPELLAGAGNRSLRRAYDSYPGGLRRACRKSTVADFRAKSRLQLSMAPTLQNVVPGGEFKYGTMSESKQSYSLATAGIIFGITRQALVNDDLGAFMDLAMRYGRSSAEFESQQLVNLLTSNPTMSDSVALFHATHKNLSGTSDAIAVASLGAGKEAMRLQKDLDAKTIIDVTPKYLIVPAKKETLAQQYLVQIQASQPSNANPFAGALELIVEPRLDAVSTTAWYMAADPVLFDTIEYSYLEGGEGPQLESRIGFSVDSVEFKCRLDFGSGVLDFRGLYKNPGA